MGKPHPIELRERVVAFVNEGHSNREAARHFRVSPRFVNNMMMLHRSSGSLTAARQGHPPGGAKLLAHADWVRERMSVRGETTLDELCVALAEHGIEVHRATVGRFLHRLGLSNKKSLKATRSADRRSPGRVTFGSIAESGSSTRPCRGSSLSMRPQRTHA
ncbi:hypothetical protein [Rhizobium sp. A37_96]